MENFIVSARKYRPETFNSVVGQNSITATLKNAIKNSHLAHAYLFCGPRGVGKTTCARIFAKTINCTNTTSDTEPCNECESCRSFNESRSYNIHELDAASNNSVEDIRLLTEKVRIPPQLGKYSVYIIDEVHMLSQSAFNAFLKTLEEPPAHAVFILATTEKHKIIPTILSRCQIFDFNRIKINDTIQYLEFIAKTENISYETEALHIIAQKADGAMRDALSIFDQVVSFSGNNIEYQSVIDNLNILDIDYYFKMTDYLTEGDITNCLLGLDEIISRGFDGHNFINGLAGHFRDLLVSKNPETIKLLEVSENLKNFYAKQSVKCSDEFLISALDICNETDYHYKASRNQRLLVELALLKMADKSGLKKKSLKSDEDKIIFSVLPGGNDKPAAEIIRNPVHEKTDKPQPAGTSHHINIPDPPVKEEPNERHARNNIVPRHNISIKNVMSGIGDQAKENITNSATESDPVPEDEQIRGYETIFSQQTLEEKWNMYAENIRAERPRMAIALKGRTPVLKENFAVEVSFENFDQKDDFMTNIKPYLQSFLRKELLNDLIIISVTHEENNDEGKRKMYSTEDKFQYLNSKNPMITKLRQKFNLEFE